MEPDTEKNQRIPTVNYVAPRWKDPPSSDWQSAFLMVKSAVSLASCLIKESPETIGPT